MKFREVKSFAQGHTARKQQSSSLNTSFMGLTLCSDRTRKPFMGTHLRDECNQKEAFEKFVGIG